jgi:putrescine aminotransferase
MKTDGNETDNGVQGTAHFEPIPEVTVPDPEFDPIAAMRRHMQPGLALAAKVIGRGAYEVEASGAEVRLSDGRRLLDFGSYAVTLFGHRPETVVDAVRRQLDLLPTSTRALVNGVTARMSERLYCVLGQGRLDRVWFGLGGTDAVEAAFKLARLATGRPRIVAVEGAFHGKSMGSLAATWSVRYRSGLDDLLVGVTHVPGVPEALSAELAQGDVAAIVFEPIQGEGGVQILPTDTLRRWSVEARAAGAFVISDEIQVGLGRCGPPSLAVDGGVDPDAVLFGKALGGGVMPLAALVCDSDMYRPLLNDPFIHSATFSGHPLSCAAGLAAVDLMEELRPRAETLAQSCRAGLFQLADDYSDVVDEVRGRGLLWGIQCHTVALAGEVLAGLSLGGLVVSPCLGRPEVIRLLPPMVTSDAQLAEGLAILDGALANARNLA